MNKLNLVHISYKLCLICWFLLTIPIFSQNNDSLLSRKLVNKIQFPEDVGIIKEVFIPEDDQVNQLIVYIQDAHCNYEAQMNISKIVKILVEDFKFSLINVEGTAGLIDTKPFSTFKDRKVKLDFADYFMKQGKITGPEYLSITSDLEFTIYGIEDEELYAQNYTAYMNALEYKDRVNAYTSKLIERLNSLKKQMYNEKLLNFDIEARKYEDKSMEFADYTLYIEKFAKENNLSLEQFTNFILQSQARTIENEMDFKKIEEQRSALITKFHEVLAEDKEQVKVIIQKSLDFRLLEISAQNYYKFLVESAKKHNINFTEFPLIEKYYEYLSLYHQIDKSRIIDEVSEIEQYIKKKLYVNPEEGDLDRLYIVMSILRKLFKLEVIKADYMFFLDNKAEFNFRKTKDFILKYGPKYNIPLGFDVNHQIVEDNLHWVIEFYEAALKRDMVLIENALKRMQEDKKDRFALVTGGFHSDGLTRILRSKNVPFILVAPRITDPTAATTYEEVMKAQAESVKGYKGIEK